MYRRCAARAAAVCLGTLAIAAPVAQATDYTADTGNAQTTITTAAGGGSNTVTLAPGDYHSLTVPSVVGDLLIIGQPGVSMQLTSQGGTLAVRRVRLTGTPAISVAPTSSAAASLRVDNSIVQGTTQVTNPSGHVQLVLSQVTQTSGSPSLTSTGPNATFVVSNSVLGTPPATGPTVGTVFCSFSSVPGSGTPPLSCSPGSTGNIANPSDLNNLFVNGPGGDFHPRTDSGLIDAGSDTQLSAPVESTTDFDGNPRRVAYAHCTVPPRRDIGAYELPQTEFPPAVGISGPTTATVGMTSIFTINGATGSVVNALWHFSDGGQAPAGATVAHTWTAPGTGTVQLVAQAAGGCQTIVTSSVTIAPAPDRTAPTITKVKLSSTKLKKTSKPKLTLTASEPIVVTTTVIRRLDGIRKNGKCVKRKSGQKGKSCLRDDPKTHAAISFPKGTSSVKLSPGKLTPGRYQLELKFKDAAGNSGKSKRLSFTVSKG